MTNIINNNIVNTLSQSNIATANPIQSYTNNLSNNNPNIKSSYLNLR